MACASGHGVKAGLASASASVSRIMGERPDIVYTSIATLVNGIPADAIHRMR